MEGGIMQFSHYDLDSSFATTIEGCGVKTIRDCRVAGTAFVVVTSGTLVVTHSDRLVVSTLGKGMCALLDSRFLVNASDGCATGVMIEVPIIRAAVPMIVGPVADFGAMAYIDGCTDSLVIPPAVKGLPCLNHLHIPAGTRQTMHTHPSLRAGVILNGYGRCITPNAVYDLHPGMAWIIPTGLQHCFYTDGESLDVIAWHPDSDCGPDDTSHPMLNRTVIDGVSAADDLRSGYRTRRMTGVAL